MRGRVVLIGAGPGDPELLTLKAARVLGEVDVVLVDDLVAPGCLRFLKPEARVIRVGKRGGCRSTPQAFIEKLLIRIARTGRRVARLKGGDPFVFGRGGEEVATLRDHGIDVEVIPGLSAGIAAPAALGIPVTHRALAHSVTLVTGHGADIDWRAHARSGATLVIYMGLRRLQEIKASLLAAGMDPRTPACIVENGTLETQKALVSSLAKLDAAGFAGPAVIVIGEVVRSAMSEKGSGPFSSLVAARSGEEKGPDPFSKVA